VVAVLTVAGGTISLIVGAALLRLSLTHTYERYIRVGMGPFLTVAGIAVIALGLVTIAHAVRRARENAPQHHHGGDSDHDHTAGDDHEHVGVGWLLLAPIAALLLVAPPTLGSFGVTRGATVDVREGAPVFDTIPRRAGPVPMSLLEYGQRAFDHDGASFNGATVQLTGFVVDGNAGDFRLARYQIACCAADATPIVVRVRSTAGVLPARDQWVTVTGVFRPAVGEVPVLAAANVIQVPVPDDPYE
jgi:putative membrane protein